MIEKLSNEMGLKSLFLVVLVLVLASEICLSEEISDTGEENRACATTNRSCTKGAPNSCCSKCDVCSCFLGMSCTCVFNERSNCPKPSVIKCGR
uniref:U3-Austrotoxin-Ht1a_1 n=2 Tax=Hickmania troglodytes TaxID=489260 RepID=A0A482ZG51_9ARAC